MYSDFAIATKLPSHCNKIRKFHWAARPLFGFESFFANNRKNKAILPNNLMYPQFYSKFYFATLPCPQIQSSSKSKNLIRKEILNLGWCIKAGCLTGPSGHLLKYFSASSFSLHNDVLDYVHSWYCNYMGTNQFHKLNMTKQLGNPKSHL